MVQCKSSQCPIQRYYAMMPLNEFNVTIAAANTSDTLSVVITVQSVNHYYRHSPPSTAVNFDIVPPPDDDYVLMRQVPILIPEPEKQSGDEIDDDDDDDDVVVVDDDDDKDYNLTGQEIAEATAKPTLSGAKPEDRSQPAKEPEAKPEFRSQPAKKPSSSKSGSGSGSGYNVGLVAGIIALAIIAGTLIGLMVFFLKWRKKPRMVCKQPPPPVYPQAEITPREPICPEPKTKSSETFDHSFYVVKNRRRTPISCLRRDYEDRLRPNSHYAMKSEFERVPSGPTDSADEARSPHNVPLNRSQEVLPYDKNRVRLTRGQVADRTYINASLIRTVCHQPAIVVTQCPTKDTVGEFWRTVWDLNIGSVVMLVPCDCPDYQGPIYWPQRTETPTIYCSVQVELVTETKRAHFVLRRFCLHGWQGECVVSRLVSQWQFIHWTPLSSLPHHPVQFLDFLRDFQTKHSAETGVLVHCILGSGCSGIFLAVDALSTEGRRTGQVDIQECATLLCLERMNVIQTFRHYRYIYYCLIELFDNGHDTCIPVSCFHFAYTNLIQRGKQSGLSRLDHEFCVLSFPCYGVSPQLSNRKRSTSSENTNFNNSGKLIVGDDLVCVLDGYLTSHLFVIPRHRAQFAAEFWKTILDHNARTAVVLRPTEQSGLTVPCQGACRSDGEYLVECKRIRQNPGRSFMVYNLAIAQRICSGDVVWQPVRLYEFLAWPDAVELPEVGTILDLVSNMAEWCRRDCQGRSTLFFVSQSPTDESRAAIVCAIWTVLDRIHAENFVDIYMAARYVSSFIPSAFASLDQYHFIYKVIDEHVTRMDNFPAVHGSTEDRSPTHSSPCRTPAMAQRVPYQHKWVSPDELPCRDIKPVCRDIKPPSPPTRPLPCRDRITHAKEPSVHRPCIEKKQSYAVKTEKCKKQREPRRREKCPPVDRKTERRSVSPCYNLQSTSASHKPARTQTISPMRDHTASHKPCVDNATRIYPTTSGQPPKDCKPKLPTDKKTPCRKPKPCQPGKKPDSATARPRPCRQLDPIKAKPETTESATKPHSRCAQRELSKTSEKVDLSKEMPCEQATDVEQLPTTTEPCENMPTSDVVVYLDETKEEEAHEHKRASSAERQCKNKPSSDVVVYMDDSAHENTPVVYGEQATDHAELHKRCTHVSKPTPSEIEKPPTSDVLSVHSPVRQTGQHRREKPCAKPETTEQAVSVKQKPCTETTVEETNQNRRRCRTRRVKRNKEMSTKTDSAVIPVLKRDCKERSALKTYEQESSADEKTQTKQQMRADSLKITEKPCKSIDLPATILQEGTVAKKDSTTEALKTKQHLGFSQEKPCRKNTDMHAEIKVTSETKEPRMKIIEKPCGNNGAIESSRITKPEGLIREKIAQDADIEHLNKKHEKKPCKDKMIQQQCLQTIQCAEKSAEKSPCQPVKEAKDTISSDQSIKNKKHCTDKPAAESTAQKQCREKTVPEPVSFTAREADIQLDTEQKCNEDELAQCTGGISNSVIAFRSQTSSLLGRQNENHSNKEELHQAFTLPMESLPNETITQVIQPAIQQVAIPTGEADCTEVLHVVQTSEAQEEEEESFASYSPKSVTDTCCYPDVEILKTSQQMSIPTSSELKPVQDEVQELSTVHNTFEHMCQDSSQNQTETPNQQELPCPKSRMFTSDQSVESASRVIRRCKQARILKSFDYKKLPCKSVLQQSSSKSVQSGITVSSYQMNADDQSDYESGVTSSRAQSYSHQDIFTSAENTVFSRSYDNYKPLQVSAMDSKEMTERTENVDFNNVYSTERTKTAEDMQSLLSDCNVTVMRNAQSDDHEVMTRRQNMSSDDKMHVSEPTMDVEDLLASATMTDKSKKNRRDSGTMPLLISKPLAVPGTVVEDPPTLDWNSSDNNSSQVVLQTNIPYKLDSSPVHQSYAAKGGLSSIPQTVRTDSDKTRSQMTHTTKVPEKAEGDPDMSNISHDIDAKSRQSNRDNSNSCDVKESDEFVDTDWSDSSSQHQQTMSSGSEGKQYFVEKPMATEALEINSQARLNQASERFDQSSSNSPPSDVDSLKAFIASLKSDETI